MGLIDTIRGRINSWLMGDEYMNRGFINKLEERQINTSYYQGKQIRPMKVKPMQADDNIITNFTRLIVDRSVSLLLGGGVSFDLPGEDEGPEQLYIDEIMAANNSDILLLKAAMYASAIDNGYIKIIPDGLTHHGKVYPRLVALNSSFMFIEPLPEDMDIVRQYMWRANVVEDGVEVARKQIVRWDSFDGEDNRPLSWVIEDFKSDKGGRWELISSEPWPYPFPPIVHWQNLPNMDSVYGMPDIPQDTREIQDRINFVSSNISRIIRYHAHPKTWGSNVNLGNRVSWGGDEMVTVTGDGRIENLEMQSDLASSAAYLENLRQSLFDVTRTVDISSMADKMGQLTNFGLRVLYGDAIAKLNTKQALMGEALEELVYRLLVLGGFANDDPGKVIWPDNLPRNEFEDLQAQQIELTNGLVSKQTVATENGRDWELEQERLAAEETANTNVGALALQSFFNGGV